MRSLRYSRALGLLLPLIAACGSSDDGGETTPSEDTGSAVDTSVTIDTGTTPEDTGTAPDTNMAGDSSPTDTGSPDTTVADTGVAADTKPDAVDTGTIVDSTVADTSVADTFVADTFVADTFVADTFVADTFVADTFVADTFVADAPSETSGSTCTDGIKNGTETDIDCGGGTCPACSVTKACLVPTDCKSLFCNAFDKTCTGTCTDGEKGPGETDIDCGGTTCSACADGKKCISGTDCIVGSMCISGVCGAKPTSCNELHTQQPAAPSGVYSIDPDGSGGAAPFNAYCDMSTDGGGWTLVLAYAHTGGTNPALVPGTRPTSPSGFSHYDHAQMAALASFSSMRLFCTTSAHSRVMNFKTSNAGAINYFRETSSSNVVGNWTSGYTLLAGHTANLPAGTTDVYTGIVDSYHMTEFPFWKSGTWHWGIRGLGGRWECDDYPGNAANTTLHQVWVR